MINEVIRKFKKQYRKDYGVRGEWHGQCFEACIDFQEALGDAGLITEDGMGVHYDIMHLDTPHSEIDHPWLGKVDHWVFRLGDTYYDWSLRQFYDAAPYPLIWKQKELD